MVYSFEGGVAAVVDGGGSWLLSLWVYGVSGGQDSRLSGVCMRIVSISTTTADPFFGDVGSLAAVASLSFFFAFRLSMNARIDMAMEHCSR